MNREAFTTVAGGGVHHRSFNKLIEPPTRFPKVGRIRCRNELGGMLHYYYREAA
jgi:hypothetical protein